MASNSASSTVICSTDSTIATYHSPSLLARQIAHEALKQSDSAYSAWSTSPHNALGESPRTISHFTVI